MLETVGGFVEHVRRFYYAVVLADHDCPQCNGNLGMKGEGRCTCQSCSAEFDPTLAFQRCPGCGGNLQLCVRRYQCSTCGRDVVSRFLFDGLVFNAEYFRKKMVEHRQRKKALKERVQAMLADTRSSALETGAVMGLEAVPGLLDALNGLTAGLAAAPGYEPRGGFNLKLYERHLQAYIEDFPVSLEDLPALNEDVRKDRIWRFIAIIFMAHARLLDVWQEGQTIMVMKT